MLYHRQLLFLIDANHRSELAEMAEMAEKSCGRQSHPPITQRCSLYIHISTLTT